jgi:glycosyltransferase involved in cell wall biosynthesis
LNDVSSPKEKPSQHFSLLHCYAGNLYGGIERQLVMFARSRMEYNPLGRSFALCFEGRLTDELSKTEAVVYPMGKVKISRMWTVMRARWRLKKLLQKKQFDVAICHAMWPLLVFGKTIRRRGIPLVAWAHDTPSHVDLTERLALRTKPDLVIANSQFTHDYWKKHHPDVPCRVQYYAIHRPVCSNPTEVRQTKRQELETSMDDRVILMAARFEDWKGHTFLLDALAAMRDDPGWKCWIAGGIQRPIEEERVRKLKEQAQQAGISDRIRWLGGRTDVFDLMNAADIYCQPNLGPEPFGVVFVEAMYAGIPIITSNMGGPAEFVSHECGRLVTAGKTQELVNALRELLANPSLRSQLGTRGQEIASSKFDFETNIRDLNRTFEELVSGHKLACK